jgi:hypothetical protein
VLPIKVNSTGKRSEEKSKQDKEKQSVNYPFSSPCTSSEFRLMALAYEKAPSKPQSNQQKPRLSKHTPKTQSKYKNNQSIEQKKKN